MKNPVMNYNQFMAAFKKSAAGYSGKADIDNDDANGTAKVDQEMAEGPVKGKGTPQLSAATKKFMSANKGKAGTKK